MWNEVQTRLNEMNLQLPNSPAPRGQYRAVTVHGSIAYVAGQVSRFANEVVTGPVDRTTSPDRIKLAAETCVLRALGALTTIQDDYVLDRILFLRGYVNATNDFTGHSAVLDHASILLQAIFGERGTHSRSAVGVASLPSAGLLEIELIVAVTAKANAAVATATLEPGRPPSPGDHP
jgi:enamine deaminase RidA (YjgF/YER057c/UK114 family)